LYDPEKIRNYFNEYGSKEWNRLQRNLHGIVEHETTMSVLKRHLPSKGYILDAGGGPGRYSIELAKLGYTMALIDISEEQLRIADEKIIEAGVTSSVTLNRMDICNLEKLQGSTYDAVLCLGGALSYVRERAGEAVSELIRVAKPGAPIVFSVMSLLGTFHTISTFDDDDFLENIENHVEWSPTTVFPEYINSKIGSYEWHAPMTLYTSRGLKELLESKGLRMEEVAATNTITSSYFRGLDKITSNPKAAEMLLRLEREFCVKPGLVDMGEHLIAVART
jgi:ubiquinone/menaquinone biosynthesis C-methylase UbiE